MELNKRQKKQLRENYRSILPPLTKKQLMRASLIPDSPLPNFEGRMTFNELCWALEFEELEWAIKRDRADDAEVALRALGTDSLDEIMKEVRQEIQDKFKGNPVRVETKRKLQLADKKTSRTVKNGVYDALDYCDVSGKTKCNSKDFFYPTMLEPADPRNSNVNDVPLAFVDEGDFPAHRRRIEPGLDPDQEAVTVTPEDGIIEALDKAKGGKIEALLCQYKQSKAAKKELSDKSQPMEFAGMTYTYRGGTFTPKTSPIHGFPRMQLDYIQRSPKGRLWVLDRHNRLQPLTTYLKQETYDSFATHAEVYYEGQATEFWVYRPGVKRGEDGIAVLFQEEPPKGRVPQDLIRLRHRRYQVLYMLSERRRAYPLATCRKRHKARTQNSG